MTTLILATRNRHKVEEIQSILATSFDFLSLRDFPDAPPVIEDAPTFAGNATKKAVALARWIGSLGLTGKLATCYILADDSGLEVDALGGAPGVHSARFAALDGPLGENAPDAANNAKLLHLLRDVPASRRTARFRCVLALTPVSTPATSSASPVCAADELELQTELFDGTCEGGIAFIPRGEAGFGYDPLFIPLGQESSFAELGEQAKNAISHRSQALARLRQRVSRF